MKYIFALAALAGTASMAMGVTWSPTPGPLLGVIGGPWGVAVAAVGYGVYRVYKART
ncbi:MAG: hypothetical protein ABIN69_03170 [Aestuariivirga sp.]|jgi:hypothetical protein